MLFFLVIVIMILIVSFGWMFLSYNFVYDFAYLKNFNEIQNYKIFQQNEKLFKYYFENTTWKFNQFYWFVPPKSNLDLWTYNFSGLKIYFTGYVFLNDKQIDVKSWDDLNYSWTYQISLKNSFTWWQYFFIDWFTWNFTCNSWVYYQKLWYKKFERKYIIFTSTWFNLNLLSGDYDGWWKKMT